MRQTNSFDLAEKGYYHLILSNIHDSRVYKYNDTYLCVFVLEGKQTVEINKKTYNLVEFDYLIIRPQDELQLVENEEKRQSL